MDRRRGGGGNGRGTLRVTHRFNAPGHAGILATVETMRDLAWQGAEDPQVWEWADAINRSTCCPEAAATGIRAFLGRHTRFLADPPGVEFIRNPLYMLRRIRRRGYAEGDCDDIATLGAALGLATMLPARFRLLSFGPSEPWEHVYTELWDGRGWLELDTTRPAQYPPGLRVWSDRIEEL